jgi:toxin ParE1/3/4
MAGRTELSREARHDLVEIGRYTQNRWGRRKRFEYLSAILARLDELAANPAIGRTRSELGSDLRSLSVDRLVAFYRTT